MYIEPRLDAGPMILKRNVAIQQNETASELHDRLSVLGAEAVIEAIALLRSGKASPKTQEEAQVTYASKITKEEALLDFNRPAEALARKVRAFNAWPVAETRYQGTVMRIWRAEAMTHALPAPPGTLLVLEGRLLIATPEGSLNVLELQLPGGKRISSKDFLNAKPTLPIQLEGF
jgi:methionyl-tRNA formyltransferase